MNYKQQTLPLIFSAILLSACGGGGSSSSTDETGGTGGTSITAYEGTWKGPCFINSFDATSSQTTLTINSGANSGTYNVKNLVGTTCGSTVNTESIIDVTLNYPGSYSSSVCANASNVDLTIIEPIKITDHTGYAGFPPGTTVEYTQQEFENLIALSNQTLSDHIQLFTLICSKADGTALYGGDPTATNDGSTSSKRPTELAIDHPFTKQ